MSWLRSPIDRCSFSPLALLDFRWSDLGKNIARQARPYMNWLSDLLLCLLWWLGQWEAKIIGSSLIQELGPLISGLFLPTTISNSAGDSFFWFRGGGSQESRGAERYREWMEDTLITERKSIAARIHGGKSSLNWLRRRKVSLSEILEALALAEPWHLYFELSLF